MEQHTCAPPPTSAPVPAPGQPSFYYYNPEPDVQHGQHGYFSPHPNGIQQHVPHPMMMAQPRQPNYPHQHRSSPDQQNVAAQYGARPMSGKAFLSPRSTLSPSLSPRQLHIKPSVLLHQGTSPALLPLDTNCVGPDFPGFPSTPPLSTSGSISSAPSSCGMLNTPVNGGSFRFEGIEGVKEGCEEDVELEILANCDWARSASPEMTPGES